MSVNNIQDYAEFELEYKAENKRKIKIFDSRFVTVNRNKCKIIYNGNENVITEYLKIDMDSNHNNIIKIQLKINKNITDINYMFEDCKTLLSFRENTVDISNIKNMKNFLD